jgi:hypothetical protein
MTLGRIIDMRVDPAFEDILFIPVRFGMAHPANPPYLEVFGLCVRLL